MAQKDLIPLNQRTKEEQKRITTQGGKASVIARRKKKLEQKTAQQIVQAFFAEEKETLSGKKITQKEYMLLNAIKRTMNSIVSDNGRKKPLQNEDLKAVEYFLSLVGEAPVIKTQNEQIISAPIQIIDDVDNSCTSSTYTVAVETNDKDKKEE